MSSRRLEWVDAAKGLCTLLFVLLCVFSAAAGNSDIAGTGAHWLTPFVLPAFFLLAGLFLQDLLFGSKTVFLDRKIIFFVYFYILWTAIETVSLETAALAHPLSLAGQFLKRLVLPTGGLWLIQLLVVMNMLTWLCRYIRPSRLVAIAMFFQLCVSAHLLRTGISIIDGMAAYYVFYLIGYAGAPIALKFGKGVSGGFKDIPVILLVWAALNTAYVFTGLAGLPMISLFMGLAGALAVMALSALALASRLGPALHYIGQHSFAICLGFSTSATLTARMLGAHQGEFALMLAALLVFASAVGLPLLIQNLTRNMRLKYLFVRPVFAQLAMAQRETRTGLLSQPSEMHSHRG